jgi:hypothetical protein
MGFSWVQVQVWKKIPAVYPCNSLSNQARSSANNDHDLKLGWLRSADERIKITIEGSVLYWATAFMAFSHAFINCALAKAAIPPPFTVPCTICYVHESMNTSLYYFILKRFNSTR